MIQAEKAGSAQINKQVPIFCDAQAMAAMVQFPEFVAAGGLMSYGGSAAINLKTAKALGLTIPETLLATADEVIQ